MCVQSRNLARHACGGTCHIRPRSIVMPCPARCNVARVRRVHSFCRSRDALHSTTSLTPPSVIWYIASCSARHGESVILPTRVSPLPLRSEMRVSDACASTCPPTAFLASGTNLSRVRREGVVAAGDALREMATGRLRTGYGGMRRRRPWKGTAGWSGGAVRSHCAGVSADLVGQDDREVELRGETARRGRGQGAVLHVCGRGTRWARRRGAGHARGDARHIAPLCSL